MQRRCRYPCISERHVYSVKVFETPANWKPLRTALGLGKGGVSSPSIPVSRVSEEGCYEAASKVTCQATMRTLGDKSQD
jgi:hypothetical protein